MKRNALKWTVIGGALAVIILYGIDMSSAGIERIYGPMEGVDAYAETVEPEPTANAATDFVRAQQQKIAQLEKELAEVKRLTALAEGSELPEQSGSIPEENERLPGVPLEVDQPAVNRIADSTSGLLQSMSSEGIRFVVSIFDGLTK